MKIEHKIFESMKRIVVIVIALLSVIFAGTAQESAVYRVTYDCDALYSKNRDIYRWVLDIGTDKAVFYNSVMRAFLKEKENVMKVSDMAEAMALVTKITSTYSGRHALQVLVDRKTNSYTYSNRIGTDTFIYEEPMPDVSWELVDSSKLVCGYQCHKAVGRLYGREWTVWYAPSIPLPFGPYVLGGLPGLIMEAEDSEGYFDFVAVGLEEAPDGTPADILRSGEQIRCNRKKYLSMRASEDGKTYRESLSGKFGDIKVTDAKGNNITDSAKPKKNYLDVE